MKTLQERLHIKADMISLGERITWGSDSAIMEEAAEALTAKEAEIERLKKDTAMLDWMDQNVFHREMDEWDTRQRKDKAIWVFFSPSGFQGSTRRIITKAMTQEAKP